MLQLPKFEEGLLDRSVASRLQCLPLPDLLLRMLGMRRFLDGKGFCGFWIDGRLFTSLNGGTLDQLARRGSPACAELYHFLNLAAADGERVEGKNPLRNLFGDLLGYKAGYID